MASALAFLQEWYGGRIMVLAHRAPQGSSIRWLWTGLHGLKIVRTVGSNPLVELAVGRPGRLAEMSGQNLRSRNIDLRSGRGGRPPSQTNSDAPDPRSGLQGSSLGVEFQNLGSER